MWIELWTVPGSDNNFKWHLSQLLNPDEQKMELLTDTTNVDNCENDMFQL